MECSGISDNLHPGISYPEECLQLLQMQEEAWADLKFHKNVQVTVPFESTGIYNFTGGMFLLDKSLHSISRQPTIGYSYITLSSLTSTKDRKL